MPWYETRSSVRITALLGVLATSCLTVDLPAQDVDLHAYVDGRYVVADHAHAWTDGGLGKVRFGKGDTGMQFGGVGLLATAQFTPSLSGRADIQFQTTDQSTVDIFEAYLRFRPVSTTRWRGSAKLGAFVPPVSLENDAIGWTSSWTLTPSALNSWVGEELRAIGVEGELEWRGVVYALELRTALFEGNDPTGNLLAVRGWSLSDLTYGIGSSLPEPDLYVIDMGGTPPRRYDPFIEIDNRVGWYADATLHSVGNGLLSLMRYDNRADPAAYADGGSGERVYAWDTSFWSLGARTRSGPLTWIFQAMDGSTIIEPNPGLVLETGFRSAFLLVGWNRGTWRPAVRIDHFSTSDPPLRDGSEQGERGTAVTLAINWRPRDWVRITGEIVRVSSRRRQRVTYGLPLDVSSTQVQFGVRLMY